MSDLAEFKKQVTRDIAALRTELMAYVDRRLGASEGIVKKAMVMNQNNQLAIRDDMKKEMSIIVASAGKVIYNKVMDVIDENVMPAIEDLQTRTDYLQEDGNEVVNNYQKAVFAQCEESEGGQRRITDGKSNRWTVGDGATVGLFFDN